MINLNEMGRVKSPIRFVIPDIYLTDGVKDFVEDRDKLSYENYKRKLPWLSDCYLILFQIVGVEKLPESEEEEIYNVFDSTGKFKMYWARTNDDGYISYEDSLQDDLVDGHVDYRILSLYSKEDDEGYIWSLERRGTPSRKNKNKRSLIDLIKIPEFGGILEPESVR